MPERWRRCALQFRNDTLRQNLAQLNAPLVEGIDIPDCALGERGVFVERHQFAEGFGCQFFGEDHVRRPVTFEDSVRNEPRWRALRRDLLRGLSKGQSLSLRADVGNQDVVVTAKFVERLRKSDEIARDEPRPLMNQLIEGVLAVGSRLAPIDGTGVAFNRLTFDRSHACHCSPWSVAGGRLGIVSDIVRRAGRQRSALQKNRCTRPPEAP
jgi:hypothetical protein